MDRHKLRQWKVLTAGKAMGIFTPCICDSDTAMAIAVATFGADIDELANEGLISIELNDDHLQLSVKADWGRI